MSACLWWTTTGTSVSTVWSNCSCRRTPSERCPARIGARTLPGSTSSFWPSNNNSNTRAVSAARTEDSRPIAQTKPLVRYFEI